MIEQLIESASSYSDDIDHAIMLITVVVGVWFIAAEGLLFYFIFRFREKKEKKSQYIPGTGRQLRWVMIPLALVVLCDIFLIAADMGLWINIKQKLPEPDAEIRIIAQQWSWTFQHPGPDGKLDTKDDVVMVDELHVEVNKVYHFHMESRDVLHSFSVPVFRLKQDIVPGRVITGWFEPTKTGEHDIQCVEMCGIGHGAMGARIFIEGASQHAAWLGEHSTFASLGGEQ